jgi:hypothetical protein
VKTDYAKVRLSEDTETKSMSESERRQFQRVSFDTPAKLSLEQQEFSCQIIDLSIHGVLLRAHGVVNSKIGTRYSLSIPLGQDNASQAESINMQVTLAHNSPESLGFACESISLESITHLRRIVELNSGNSDLLERELESLIER